ncbi:MAG: transposase [Clostridiales bacterium]|nr:transposase [Clostridiales bacterium]
MPRRARSKSKSGIYHIILRGINRQNIFEDVDDRLKFIEILDWYKRKFHFEIYAFCLMDNHVHVLINEMDGSVSDIMRGIGGAYVVRYNSKYKRIGNLFQDRYKSETVEDERYLLTVLRYIHRNPIKAGMASAPETYPWSSYKEYIGESRLVNVNYILNYFDSDRQKAKKLLINYHSMIDENEAGDECMDTECESVRMADRSKWIVECISNTKSATEFQRLERHKRDEYLKALLSDGMSIRQIERITGISRGIIYAVKTKA